MNKVIWNINFCGRYELKILSSNRQSIPANYDDKSVLVVEVEVLDINDNPPHFDKSYYSNGISTINAQQSTVITVSVSGKVSGKFSANPRF